ncbi:unnamed protein product, partial [Ectocarpus fasciculatus]
MGRKCGGWASRVLGLGHVPLGDGCCEAYGKGVTVERSIEALGRKRRWNSPGGGCSQPGYIYLQGAGERLVSVSHVVLLARRKSSLVVGAARIRSNCTYMSLRTGCILSNGCSVLLTLGRRRDKLTD